MVAIIHCTRSISRNLKYNESKVSLNLALCIRAANYSKDLALLSYSDKLHGLVNLAALNKRVRVNGIHISLNFHREDRPGKEKLLLIAMEYMERMGLGRQPYLVYEHYDAAHPHLHILSTSIRSDGEQIKLYWIIHRHSKPAATELEIKYGLTRAEQMIDTWEDSAGRETCRPLRLVYGRVDLFRSIGETLDHILGHYKVSSIAELNAVLRLYNLLADRGGVASVMYQQGGLLYRVLQQDGRRIGIPIKASILPHKPTLKNMQSLFDKNLPLKPGLSGIIRTPVDWILYKNKNISIQRLAEELRLEGIAAMITLRRDGFIQDITYIHHKKGAVIPGDELGKNYSANFIFEKCGLNGQQFPVPDKKISGAGQSAGDILPAGKKQSPRRQWFVKFGVESVTLGPLLQKTRMMDLEELIRCLPKIEGFPSAVYPGRNQGRRMVETPGR